MVRSPVKVSAEAALRYSAPIICTGGNISMKAALRCSAPIIVTGGDKGGTGKSFVARILAAWLRRHGYLVHGFDGDARNAHLERYYGDSFTVERPYLRKDAGWDALFFGWENSAENEVLLVDLPGSIGDAVEREMERVQLMAEAFGRELIHVWVADEEEDSVTLLERLHPLTSWPQTLVVLNGRFGANANAFELWSESDIRSELLREGGHETFLPALPIQVRTRIARAHAPFDDVSRAKLTVYQTVDLDIWLKRVDAAFLPLAKIMESLA